MATKAKMVKQCQFCHADLDPAWDGKDECNRYACWVTRAPGFVVEPITATEGARLSHQFAARLRTPKTEGTK